MLTAAINTQLVHEPAVNAGASLSLTAWHPDAAAAAASAADVAVAVAAQLAYLQALFNCCFTVRGGHSIVLCLKLDDSCTRLVSEGASRNHPSLLEHLLRFFADS